MNANEYLQSSTLYRKLIHGPHGKFSQVYAARLSDEGFGRRCTWRNEDSFYASWQGKVPQLSSWKPAEAPIIGSENSSSYAMSQVDCPAIRGNRPVATACPPSS